MRLDPRALHALVRIYPSLDEGYLATQSQQPCCRWDGRQAFVAWELVLRRTPGATDLSLADTVDQEAHDGAPGHGGNPCRFLQPPGSHSRRVLAPAQARFHGRGLLLLGLEQLGICTDLRAACGGEYRPAIVLLRVHQRLDLAHTSIPRLSRWGGWLGGTAPPRTARGAGVGHDTRADGVVPPGLRPAPSPARSPGLIGRDGRCGIRRTRQPSRVDIVPMGCHGFGFLRLGVGLRLGLLGRQWTRMPHDQPECRQDDASVAGLDLDLPEHALPMPVARGCVLGPPRLCHPPRQRGRLLSPACACLPHGTGARDSRHEPELTLQTQAPGTATLGLALCDNPAHTFKA